MNSKEYLSEQAHRHRAKIEPLKLFVSDVDGIMTDGGIEYHSEEMGWSRKFNVRDGYGLILLKEAGMKIGIATAGTGEILKKRFDRLAPHFLSFSSMDKLGAIEEMKKKLGLSFEEICYIGDDLFDIAALKKVGFSGTVSDAAFEVFECVDYITQLPGGKGALREFVDIIRIGKNYI